MAFCVADWRYEWREADLWGIYIFFNYFRKSILFFRVNFIEFLFNNLSAFQQTHTKKKKVFFTDSSCNHYWCSPVPLGVSTEPCTLRSVPQQVESLTSSDPLSPPEKYKKRRLKKCKKKKKKRKEKNSQTISHKTDLIQHCHTMGQ